jgi:hypothetical protein
MPHSGAGLTENCDWTRRYLQGRARARRNGDPQCVESFLECVLRAPCHITHYTSLFEDRLAQIKFEHQDPPVPSIANRSAVGLWLLNTSDLGVHLRKLTNERVDVDVVLSDSRKRRGGGEDRIPCEFEF